MLFLICAVIDDTTKEIVYRDYVDISVAVATPKASPSYASYAEINAFIHQGCIQFIKSEGYL